MTLLSFALAVLLGHIFFGLSIPHTILFVLLVVWLVGD